MPAVRFGDCPTRTDSHIGPRLRRAPSPYPRAHHSATLDDDSDADTDSLSSPSLPALSRAPSPYAEMSPYAPADYAVDFSGDTVVETVPRRVEFFVPARGSFSAPRVHAPLERCPTPYPYTYPDPEAPHPCGVVECVGKCVKIWVGRALVCCGLKRGARRGDRKG